MKTISLFLLLLFIGVGVYAQQGTLLIKNNTECKFEIYSGIMEVNSELRDFSNVFNPLYLILPGDNLLTYNDVASAEAWTTVPISSRFLSFKYLTDNCGGIIGEALLFDTQYCNCSSSGLINMSWLNNGIDVIVEINP